MKAFIALIVTMFALTSFAAEPAKKEEQPNCVTKDKKGNCPPPPKSPKPTPKKKADDKKADSDKKADAPKAAASAPAPTAKASEPAKK